MKNESEVMMDNMGIVDKFKGGYRRRMIVVVEMQYNGDIRDGYIGK